MKNKRDENEAEIVAFWRSRDCIWIPMDRNAGFDGVLVDPILQKVHIVEIKNWKLKWHLTEAEKKLRSEIGNLYHIVCNMDDAACLAAVANDVVIPIHDQDWHGASCTCGYCHAMREVGK